VKSPTRAANDLQAGTDIAEPDGGTYGMSDTAWPLAYDQTGWHIGFPGERCSNRAAL